MTLEDGSPENRFSRSFRRASSDSFVTTAEELSLGEPEGIGNVMPVLLDPNTKPLVPDENGFGVVTVVVAVVPPKTAEEEVFFPNATEGEVEGIVKPLPKPVEADTPKPLDTVEFLVEDPKELLVPPNE